MSSSGRHANDARSVSVKRLASLLPVAAVALAGCVLGPDYRRPEIEVPASFGRGAEPVASGPAKEQPPGPAEAEGRQSIAGEDLLATAWWRAFGDAQLEQLIGIALEENKDLRIAAHRIDRYEAALQVSRAARLPEAGYFGSRSRDWLSQNTQVKLNPGTDPVDNSYVIGAKATWEIDLWGRIRRANEAAAAELMAVEENRRALVTSLVSELISTYLKLLSVDREIELLQEAITNHRETVRLLEAKSSGGRIPEIQVVDARIELERAQSALPLKEREAASLENALSELLGRNPGPIARGAKLDALRLPVIPAGVPAQVLAQRPDVRRAEQELVAANARIGVAKSQYLPAVSLTAQQGFASDELSKLLLLSSNFGTLGVMLLGPIFDGGRIAGRVREAEAIQREAATAYVRTVQGALREVEDALVWHEKVVRQSESRAREVEALRLRADLSRKRQAGGMGDMIQVLHAERAVAEGLAAQLQNRRDLGLSMLAVYKSMGGSWSVADQFPADLVKAKIDND
jgi:multidrug efflux system outer membrane protein